MSKDNVVGRPNKPKPPDLDEARQISDVASRRFTPDSKGTAMPYAPPAGAGHSYNPADPWQYAKEKRQHR